MEIVAEEARVKEPILIEGFHGVGMVGTLAAQFIVNKLKSKLIGYIDSDKLPSIAMLSKGEANYPIRMHAIEAKNLLVVESEIPIPKEEKREIAKELVKWCKEKKVKRVVCLEGIPTGGEGVFGIVSESKLKGEIEEHAKLIESGIIMGLAASILLEGKLQSVPVICLIAECKPDYPDGIAAARLLEKLNALYNISIDPEELVEETKRFIDKMSQIVKELEEKKVRSIIYG